MSKIKRIISSALAACLCTSCINALPVLAATGSEEVGNILQNGGFEDGVFQFKSQGYAQPQASDVPYWNTTASAKTIEIFIANDGTYISGKKLEPREGSQAAELNVEEASSLYQNIKTTPGSFIEWGISHHGRKGPDTMLLVIGPKQAVEPLKKSKTDTDQFMKLGKYLHEHDEYKYLIPEKNGASQEFVLYSPEFAADGKFKTSDEPFTTAKTNDNTEEWHIWFIKSDNTGWHDYGTAVQDAADSLGYNNIYEVPEGQEETIFALTAYNSAGDIITYGNMIDNVQFGLLYKVSIEALKGGSGSVTATQGNNLEVSYMGDATDASNAFAWDKYYTGSTITLSAKNDADNDYEFVGATINGVLFPHDTFTYDQDDPNHIKHTMDVPVNENKYVKFMFAKKGHISYDPNGGTFLGTDNVTDRKYDHYTNNNTPELEVPLNKPAVFTGWKLYSNEGETDILIPAEHTVTYDVTYDVTSGVNNPTITITWKDTDDTKQSVILPAGEEHGIVLVAQYTYTHEVVALTNGGSGGSVGIKNATNNEDFITGSGSRTTGKEGDTITVSAVPADGYQFDGWFETKDGTAVSKEHEYSYVVTGNSIIYAKFSKIVETLSPYLSYVAENGTNDTNNADGVFSKSHVKYLGNTLWSYDDEAHAYEGNNTYGHSISTGFTTLISNADIGANTHIIWDITFKAGQDNLGRGNMFIKLPGPTTLDASEVVSDSDSVEKNKGTIYRINSFNNNAETAEIKIKDSINSTVNGGVSIMCGIVLDTIYASGATATVELGNSSSKCDFDISGNDNRKFHAQSFEEFMNSGYNDYSE